MSIIPTIIITLFISFLPLQCLCFTSFLFGDSLVDTGNNNYLFTLSKANSPPYGIDFLSSHGKPTGRFTNGRTVSDIIGQALGGSDFPPPFLAPNALHNVVRGGGINYASGSAGILVDTGSLFIGRITFPEQVDYFKQSRDYMVKTLGEEGTLSVLKNAIFSIAIGANDMINYIGPSVPFIGHPTSVDPSVFQDYMVSNMTAQLKRLHDLGARKILVLGIGPLGCIPFVRAIKLEFTSLCSDNVNELVQGYNGKLRLELEHLNKERAPDAIFVYANSYKVFMDIILNLHSYGFEHVKDPCCGGYVPPFVCPNGYPSTNSSSHWCKDRSKYVFWDAYHPTEAMNVILAEKLLNGDPRITSPININQLYHYKFKN